MTQIIAHRGARNLWAENSLQGFRNVVALGVGAVEFDLHLGAGGEILVIHDATLDRTTTGTGPVRALTEDSRHALRLIGPDGEIDEGVPTLSEVLDILAPVPGLRLFPEIKADENGVYDPALVIGTIEMLRAYGLAPRTVLHSFDTGVLRMIRAAAPEFARKVSVNRDWAERQGGIRAFCGGLGDLVGMVAVHHELLEAELEAVSSLFPLQKIGVWTLNDPDLIARWLRRGVGFITTDDPRMAKDIMAQEMAL